MISGRRPFTIYCGAFRPGLRTAIVSDIQSNKGVELRYAVQRCIVTRLNNIGLSYWRIDHHQIELALDIVIQSARRAVALGLCDPHWNGFIKLRIFYLIF